MLQLRPYQEECLQGIIDQHAKGISRQLIVLPTGAGKTVIFSHLIQRLGRRTLVIAHTNELLEQAKDKINMICPGLNVGLLNGNHRDFNADILIASIQSARQQGNLRKLKEQGFTLLIYDESQHICSDSSRTVLNALGFSSKNCGNGRLLVGFTATPIRMDGRGLGEDFQKITYQKLLKEMIHEGYLCSPKGVRVTSDLDLSQVTVDDGDYSAISLSKVMDTDQMNNLIVTTYLDKCPDRKAICFGVTVEHAQHLAQHFQAHGVAADVIHGGMASKDRESVLARFKRGEITILSNCQVLTEGFDEPSTDAIIVAKPTQSPGLYQQMCGRGLRLWPGKQDCIILDFGDKHHKIMEVATLLGDAEICKIEKPQSESMISLAKSLPPTINKKLRSAILQFDPFSDSFCWQKAAGGYQLKGCGNTILNIVQCGEDRFNVELFEKGSVRDIATNLNFEFAFAAGEDFARANQSLFIVSDLNAEWRNCPISDKQKALFRSYGFKVGIEELSRGQASLIISSGVLNRKAVRR